MRRKHPIADLLNDPESRQRILEKAKSQARGGLLDLIESRGTTGEPKQPEIAVPAIFGKRPQPEEIDRSRTSNEMILSREAILKDGRRVRW